MEIIQASTHLVKPFHCFSSHIPNLCPPISSLSVTTAPRRFRIISCSLLDDSRPGSAVKGFEVDPMLAVKNKATDVSPGLKGTSIYLVGINSTMKTRLGKLLADALRYYFFDSDDLVVEAAGGEAAARKFLDMDKVGFRESETEVLRQLSSMGRLVVSAGDGAVGSTTNLSLLRHGISIWVDVPLDMVAKEVVEDGVGFIGSQISSSLSHSEVLSRVEMLYKEMQGGYGVADATVSLEKVAAEVGCNVRTEDMGLEVLREIEKLIRVKKMMEEAARPF